MGPGVSLLEQSESQEDPAWQKRRAVHRRVLTVVFKYREITLSPSLFIVFCSRKEIFIP